MLPVDAHYEGIVMVEGSQTDDGEAEESERSGYQVELDALRNGKYVLYRKT